MLPPSRPPPSSTETTRVAVRASQQKLAAAMPEFRPYATMQQKDVDDCGKDMKDKDGKKGFAVFSD